MFNAVGVLVSHQYGAKNEQAIREIVGQAFLLSLLTSIVVMIILACAPYFLNWRTQPLQVALLAHELLHSLLWTIPGFMVWGVIQQTLQGIGHTKFIFVSNLINIPLEILLIYCLIFGKFGLPACGIAGVGYGLAVSFTLALIVIIAYLARSKRYKKLNLLSEVGKVHGAYLKELIRVGHAVGRQDVIGIHYATYVGITLSFLCALCLAFAFYFFPQIFLSVDINVHDPAMISLVHVATQFLAILSVFYLVESVRLVIGYGALRGLKDVRFTMLASTFAFWIMGLALAFLLGFVFHLQGAGLWWGLTLGIAVGAVAVIIRWFYLVRRIDLAQLVVVA
jgi:MATE family multidrug resistance protein